MGRIVSGGITFDAPRRATNFTYLPKARLQMSEIVVIEPGRNERNYWGDLWRYRELFRVLAWRDLAVRYKQTGIGAAWAVIPPLLPMLLFTLLFCRIPKLPSDRTAPYSLMGFSLGAP